MITLSDNEQSERRASVKYCDDLKIAVIADGENITRMIDVAGNLYPAGIPEATVAPSAVNGAAAADRVPNGFYAYSYVFAAKNRYPYLDAGKAHFGSIAPRGNPAPYFIHNVTGGPRRVTVTVTGSDRLDIDQIILYRSTMWPTSADATLAAKAGQMFAIALLPNTLPTQNYNDDLPSVTTTEQIEYDNLPAPTMQCLAYESPFLWGIGNDEMIKVVTWAGNVVNLDDTGKWFPGRNGQLVTVTGITSGGIDGRGTFIFKAGDLTGDNENTSCILTKDGTTAEVLSPATGSGTIRIVGPATTLYRSKPRNPLAWGETNIIGNNVRDPKLFARKISGGRATAIAIVPGGEYLKIDVKDPSKCYVFSLRAAGTPAFELTRREISDMSISHHHSQFIAAGADGTKILWGWDMDNHAILECDGNTQRIISHSIFNTIQHMQTETDRSQFVEGFCNENKEMNILFMPWGAGINANDLAVFQHFPSGKWGTALIGDMTATMSIRDPLTNLLRYLGGRESGFLVEHQLDIQWNQTNQFWDIHSFSGINPNMIFVDTDDILYDYLGMWAIVYTNKDDRIKFGRVIAVNLVPDVGQLISIEFDRIVEIMKSSQNYLDDIGLNAVIEGDAKLLVGCIPVVFEKVLELGNPTGLKAIESFSISGNVQPRFTDAANYGVMRFYIYSPEYSTAERVPLDAETSFGNYFDRVTYNQGNYVFEEVSTPQHGKISIRFAVVFYESLQLRTMNFDIR